MHGSHAVLSSESVRHVALAQVYPGTPGSCRKDFGLGWMRQQTKQTWVPDYWTASALVLGISACRRGFAAHISHVQEHQLPPPDLLLRKQRKRSQARFPHRDPAPPANRKGLAVCRLEAAKGIMVHAEPHMGLTVEALSTSGSPLTTEMKVSLPTRMLFACCGWYLPPVSTRPQGSANLPLSLSPY